MYAAPKATLVGMTEALVQEVEPFNIKLIPADSGKFETYFISTKNLHKVTSKIEAYYEKRKFPGDPDRDDKVLIEISQK